MLFYFLSQFIFFNFYYWPSLSYLLTQTTHNCVSIYLCIHVYLHYYSLFFSIFFPNLIFITRFYFSLTQTFCFFTLPPFTWPNYIHVFYFYFIFSLNLNFLFFLSNLTCLYTYTLVSSHTYMTYMTYIHKYLFIFVLGDFIKPLLADPDFNMMSINIY